MVLLRLREFEAFPLVVPAVALLPPALDDADSEVPEVPRDQQPELQLPLDFCGHEREFCVVFQGLF